MVRAEQSLVRSCIDGDDYDEDIWIGKFKIGKFWRTVRRDSDGKPHAFATEIEALAAARTEWWTRARELGKKG